MKDQREYDPIGKWGCYFCSLGKIAEDVTGKILTDEQVYNTYIECVISGFMGHNCFVTNPAAVLAAFFEMLDDFRVVQYVGWWNTDMKEPKMWKDLKVTHEVHRISTKVGHHFRLPNWDPMGIMGNVTITGKRFFHIEGA
jgi:hypothetical protein